LIIYYYLLIWILEEISKYFNFLQTSYLHISNIKDWILYSVFVALGFSFIENILYFYNIYQNLWFSRELVITYFLRSIFSVFVHIFASFIIWYYFSKAYLKFKETWENFIYLKIFLTWIFFWILIHSLFDISLSLGFSFIIFWYFIFWYFYMWKILLKDEIDFN
jgi:RsiW-degrading membrane proteinase PrsW (M82 family)